MRIKSWWVSPCRRLCDTAGVSWEPWKFATDSRDGADILREQRHQYQRADRGGSRLGECARRGQMRIAHLAMDRERETKWRVALADRTVHHAVDKPQLRLPCVRGRLWGACALMAVVRRGTP